MAEEGGFPLNAWCLALDPKKYVLSPEVAKQVLLLPMQGWKERGVSRDHLRGDWQLTILIVDLALSGRVTSAIPPPMQWL